MLPPLIPYLSRNLDPHLADFFPSMKMWLAKHLPLYVGFVEKKSQKSKIPDYAYVLYMVSAFNNNYYLSSLTLAFINIYCVNLILQFCFVGLNEISASMPDWFTFVFHIIIMCASG